MTGYHPDFTFLERLGVRFEGPDKLPVCNPETLESNVPGIYLAGVIVAGSRTNEIFIENGRFHGRQIAAALASNLKAQNAQSTGRSQRPSGKLRPRISSKGRHSRMRWWPRTIRWQMLAGLLLLETLSISLFALLLVRQQTNEAYQPRPNTPLLRGHLRGPAGQRGAAAEPPRLGGPVGQNDGRIAHRRHRQGHRSGRQRAVHQRRRCRPGQARAWRTRADPPASTTAIQGSSPRHGNRWESVAAIYTGNHLRGFAWVEYDKTWARRTAPSLPARHRPSSPSSGSLPRPCWCC